MRTRTLVTIAAFAAGAFMAQAQSNVYSVNVVGYVNKVMPAQSIMICNPLDNGTNDLNSLLPTVAKASTASFWTGTYFTNATKSLTAWSPNFSAPVGVGFFVNAKAALTNTFVGNVACPVGGSVTQALPANISTAVGSVIPYAGDLNTTNIGLGILAKASTASFWVTSGGYYTNSTKSATVWSPALPINVGDGWFVNSKSATNWVQTLPAN